VAKKTLRYGCVIVRFNVAVRLRRLRDWFGHRISEMKDCIEARRHGDEMMYRRGTTDYVWEDRILVFGGGGLGLGTV
jgi:hypothetical protein